MLLLLFVFIKNIISIGTIHKGIKTKRFCAASIYLIACWLLFGFMELLSAGLKGILDELEWQTCHDFCQKYNGPIVCLYDFRLDPLKNTFIRDSLITFSELFVCMLCVLIFLQKSSFSSL